MPLPPKKRNQMTEQPLYRIEELSTVGWTTIDDNVNLTQEQAKEQYRLLIEFEGLNPNRVRLRRDA